ncbi:MAG: DUF4394 domain-containing protein [Acidimicrobiia bacterium]
MIAIVAVIMLLASVALATDSGQGNRGQCGSGSGLQVIGLTTDQQLVCFRSDQPNRAAVIAPVTGLSGDTALVGIDFRPADGQLYGVGNAGGLYTIDPRSAVATKFNQLSVALSGVSFGVDVNPAADALRVISDAGQNLRFSFSAGTTTVDGTLNYPGTVPVATGVVGAAYTNNDSDTNTATTLFDIDSMLDQVVTQTPANSGQLSPTGKLGVDTDTRVGFDIHSKIRNGTTVSNTGLAALNVGGVSTLYSVDPLIGRAGRIGTFNYSIEGIAIVLAQT